MNRNRVTYTVYMTQLKEEGERVLLNDNLFHVVIVYIVDIHYIILAN